MEGKCVFLLLVCRLRATTQYFSVGALERPPSLDLSIFMDDDYDVDDDEGISFPRQRRLRMVE